MATKKQREIILAKSRGKCWYCGIELKKGWHIDHIVPVFRKTERVGELVRYKNTAKSTYKIKTIQRGLQNTENHVIENMVPACPPCNMYKTVMTVEQFRSELEKQVERGRRYSSQFKMAEKYGLIAVVKDKVEFYFETLNGPPDTG